MNKKVKIQIDLSDTIVRFGLSKKQVEEIAETTVTQAAEEFKRFWENNAARSLNSTRQQYIKGITLIKKGKFNAGVILVGDLNNMIELGCSAFDMKEGFQKSSKVKKGKKGGWYLTIPFRWSAPTSLGENTAFSGRLPISVHKVAKKILTSGGKIKIEDLPKEYQAKRSRSAISDSSLAEGKGAEYNHKSNVFEGMMKSSKIGHSHYNTMRRVSINSAVNSWIHSGLKAKDLMVKSALEMKSSGSLENLIENTIQDYLENS